jgi:hypothetical protein
VAIERPGRYDLSAGIKSSARKHGVADADIRHAIENSIFVDDLENGAHLHLGPARNAELLEVVTAIRGDGSGAVIHAMKMRSKYRYLLGGD